MKIKHSPHSRFYKFNSVDEFESARARFPLEILSTPCIDVGDRTVKCHCSGGNRKHLLPNNKAKKRYTF